MFETGRASGARVKFLPMTLELKKRVISALILAPIGFCAAFFGGWVAAVVTTIMAVLIMLEWHDVTSQKPAGIELLVKVVLVVMVGCGLWAGMLGPILVFFGSLIALTLALGLVAPAAAWGVGGLCYALALPIGAMVLRASASFGFEVVVFICFVIWTTDVFAYFAGRGLGGPKLWPLISPKKTWTGFIGGTLGGLLAGFVMCALLGVPWAAPIAGVAIALSLAGHAGDLFESWVKRRFDKKDSGQLIPGHGGVMDRLDGLLAAFLLAMLAGSWRAGLGDGAAGLLTW